MCIYGTKPLYFYAFEYFVVNDEINKYSIYVYLSGCVYLYTVICIDVFSKLQQTFVRDIWGRTGKHYSDVTMGTVASQITSITIVCATIYSGADQRKRQSSASLAFVRGIQRSPVNSTHKGPATRKMFSFDDVDMLMLGCSQGFNWDFFVYSDARVTRYSCE